MSLSASNRVLETWQALIIAGKMALILESHCHYFLTYICIFLKFRGPRKHWLWRRRSHLCHLCKSISTAETLLSILLIAFLAQWWQIDLSPTSVSMLRQPGLELLRFLMIPAAWLSEWIGQSMSDHFFCLRGPLDGSGCPYFMQGRGLKTRWPAKCKHSGTIGCFYFLLQIALRFDLPEIYMNVGCSQERETGLPSKGIVPWLLAMPAVSPKLYLFSWLGWRVWSVKSKRDYSADF